MGRSALAALLLLVACGGDAAPGADGGAPAAPAAPATPAAPVERSGPPSAVVIVADDLGWGDLSCYGSETVATPNIDRLAAEGMRFTQFYATAPLCQPSRVAMLTGRHQLRTGDFLRNVRPPQESLDDVRRALLAVPTVLRRRGYAMGLVGKWGISRRTPATPMECGYNAFAGYLGGVLDHVSHVDRSGRDDWWVGLQRRREEGYVTHLVTDHAEAFIREHAARPFVLWVCHAAPHQPYQLPGDAPVFAPGEGGRWVRPAPGTAEDAAARDTYRGMVAELDASVGRLLDLLDELDLAEDTLVAFVSDNGASDFGDNGPLRGGKDTLWEGGIRAPAIFRRPGTIPAGETADDVAWGLDLPATLSELSGLRVTPESGLDGGDLLRRLEDGRPLPGRDLCWEHELRDGRSQRAVRRGRLKLVMTGEQAALFDLVDDPGESNDLAAERPDDVAALRAAWAAWRAALDA